VCAGTDRPILACISLGWEHFVVANTLAYWLCHSGTRLHMILRLRVRILPLSPGERKWQRKKNTLAYYTVKSITVAAVLWHSHRRPFWHNQPPERFFLLPSPSARNGKLVRSEERLSCCVFICNLSLSQIFFRLVGFFLRTE